jgi:POT family proton-dependent oligopeptide transporter
VGTFLILRNAFFIDIILTASFTDGGWEWTRENASALFGSYVGLVYLSTMLGGYFADKVIGFRWAVVVVQV